MELYIGGYAQGKLTYVCAQKQIGEDGVTDGCVFRYEEKEAVRLKPVFYHFAQWVRREMETECNGGITVEKKLEELLKINPDLIIVSDEVGNGIVPIEPFERAYRERLGRILCSLAKKADRMERILCGIGQRIK